MKSFISATELCLATSHTKSDQTKFVRLVAAKKFCCWDKDFPQNSPIQTWSNICCCNVSCNLAPNQYTQWFSPWLVAATRHLLCPDIKSYHTAPLVYLQSDPPVFPEPAVLLFQHVLLLHLVVLCLLVKGTSKLKFSFVALYISHTNSNENYQYNIPLMWSCQSVILATFLFYRALIL